MRTLKILLVIFTLSQNLFAQCTVSIPSNAVVIDNDTTIGMVNQFWWVCSGDTLNGSGFHNTYYVESGGVLDMSGIEKVVYLKSGAAINCSGIDDTIYFEPGAIISCSGNHVDIPCSQIVFDYSNAPPGGCDLTSVKHPIDHSGGINIYPNPSDEKAIISFLAPLKELIKVVIINVDGKEVFKSFKELNRDRQTIEISVAGFANGIYSVHLLGKNFSYRSSLAIQH